MEVREFVPVTWSLTSWSYNNDPDPDLTNRPGRSDRCALQQCYVGTQCLGTKYRKLGNWRAIISYANNSRVERPICTFTNIGRIRRKFRAI